MFRILLRSTKKDLHTRKYMNKTLFYLNKEAKIYMYFVRIWKNHSNLAHVSMKCGLFEEYLM